MKVVLGARRHGRLESLEAYVRKTLVNTFISARRRFWRREHAYGEVPDVAGRSVDSDTGLMVRAALAELAPKQRAVLVLRYFQGKGRLGPLLKTPPLTRAQLAKLIQNPALLK